MPLQPKIALVYDRVNKLGGAERILQVLHRLYPDAPLYTSVYDPDGATWANGWDIRPSFLNRISFFRRRHHLVAPLMPYAFESFDLSAFDIVISVTSAEAKGVLTLPRQLHVCYLLTPTRYLYSHADFYQGRGVKRLITRPFLNSLRRWDQVAAARPDAYIAISQTVADRCLKYYGRPPEAVIYPPVDCLRFNHKTLPRRQAGTCPEPAEGFNHSFYLVVSRLVPYKRIDLAVKVFNQLTKENLVIIGTGSELSRLKRLAGPNITFKGQVTEQELESYYRRARALIFPGEEDFGLTVVEAQAAGLPVIAYGRGGATETIIDGQTGVFFSQPTPASLTKALLTSQTIPWYHQAIVNQARRFDTKIFELKWRQTLDRLWQTHQKSQ